MSIGQISHDPLTEPNQLPNGQQLDGQQLAKDELAHEQLGSAVSIAAENVRNAGGPFGALIVTADGQRFEDVNRVTANNDPTAHAEVTAIRAACQGLGTFDLTGAVLYTSCEPCPMCLSSALWARVSKVYFAADRHDAAAAGFDDAVFYEYFTSSKAERARLMPASNTEPGEPNVDFRISTRPG